MNTLYLKAATEQALIDALPFARSVNAQGQGIWLQSTHEFALDIIGDLYNDDAVYDGLVCITPATKIMGFHANIKCNDRILALIPAGITISLPHKILREWA